MATITAIIPAAGKGTRMGSPANGKEMLIDLITGRPMIDFAIMAAEDYGCSKIVVAIEKDTKPLLISHIQQTFPQVNILLTKPEGEWPSTVLQTEPFWDSKDNILILPDTRFNVDEGNELIDRHILRSANVSFALMPGKIMEPEKFGIVALHDVSGKPLYTVEKPGFIQEPNISAWGLIAFDAATGHDLFTAYKVRGTNYRLSNLKVEEIYLSWFKDITRNGYVETY